MTIQPKSPLAFPVPVRSVTPGMTLCDWFAGQAMAAVISGAMAAGKILSEDDFAMIADAAYGCSRAMLAERAKA